MHALGVDHDLDLVADADPGAGGEGGDELGPLDVGGDVLGAGVLLQRLGVLGDDLGGAPTNGRASSPPWNPGMGEMA